MLPSCPRLRRPEDGEGWCAERHETISAAVGHNSYSFTLYRRGLGYWYRRCSPTSGRRPWIETDPLARTVPAHVRNQVRRRYARPPLDVAEADQGCSRTRSAPVVADGHHRDEKVSRTAGGGYAGGEDGRLAPRLPAEPLVERVGASLSRCASEPPARTRGRADRRCSAPWSRNRQVRDEPLDAAIAVCCTCRSARQLRNFIRQVHRVRHDGQPEASRAADAIHVQGRVVIVESERFGDHVSLSPRPPPFSARARRAWRRRACPIRLRYHASSCCQALDDPARASSHCATILSASNCGASRRL